MNTELVIGCRYRSVKRLRVLIQIDAIEGLGPNALVCVHFLRSGERHKVPRWLIARTYRRDTAGLSEMDAR